MEKIAKKRTKLVNFSFIFGFIDVLRMSPEIYFSTGEPCDTMEKISKKRKRPKTEIDFSTDQSCFVIAVTPSNLRRDVVVMLLPYYSLIYTLVLRFYVRVVLTFDVY